MIPGHDFDIRFQTDQFVETQYKKKAKTSTTEKDVLGLEFQDDFDFVK